MTTTVNPYDCKLIKHPNELEPHGTPTPGLIPELASDPVDPEVETAWVLRQSSGLGGTPIGMLLSLTYSGQYRHFFSYHTLNHVTKRAELLP